ncbi:MAG TPA: glycoside hydrolase family 2 TIM barrel-domain containing protein [Candidatus Saccharimonadales bacterium]|nr:glycoside hydrolase family 2 TIM barrel-domain containing protein [Candidatus Saccharimonadales bacterium]
MKYTLLCVTQSLLLATACFAETFPNPVLVDAGWQLQFASQVSLKGGEIAQVGFQPDGWHAATVPGTVLTSLVDDKIYPEPLYGENNRPDKISEGLCRESYWYRTTFTAPEDYAGKKIWLHFDGINYAAEVWVNGQKAGTMRGAFARGLFDISDFVTPGKTGALAVLITPQPDPGWPHEHTLFDGMGLNGGITAVDGPTFLCTLGWDWIPAIRDRDSGIWQKVYLSATGPVVVKDPLVTSDLALPDLDSADVTIQATLENVTDQAQQGVLKANFGDVTLSTSIELAARSSRIVSLDPKAFRGLRVPHPKLWWPNGYGPQNLYKLQLDFEINGTVSDHQEVMFGVRKIAYSVSDSENLTISVNGVRILCKGGNWGLDEAMKRNPRSRLEAQIRMHQIANYTIIRNWVGQSTSEDFYELCDQYGLLLWDEFFQPNPSDGPDPTDLDTYVANVRDKILRFRNHPSIAVWCARNEGYPPKRIDDALRKLMAELEPTRLYQASSTAGRGVYSHGPYCWRPPREFYSFDANDIFKTEIGSVSIPTLESIHGMMPEKDWEVIDNDWAEHDLAKGAQRGDKYPQIINERYGQVANLADFARKGQLANYEAFRAMYEGRNAKLFKPCTGVITWMSNPAQPSFVWQIYHHDLEPNASLFAAKKACEPVHIQLNEKTWDVEVINNLPAPVTQSHASLTIYNLDGSTVYQHEFEVQAPPSAETSLGSVEWPANLSAVHFIKLEWHDAAGTLLSDNFYWRALPEQPDNLQALETLPTVTLEAEVARHDDDGKCLLEVKLHNPGSHIALMTHLQLHRQNSGERVLPVYYSDNYVSLAPGEARTISIEAAASDLQGQTPLVMIDGWNIAVKPSASTDAAVALNEEAQVNHWPVTGLPVRIE